MKKKLLAGLLTGLFLVVMVGLANANLIVNGDFDTLDLTGWTVTGGTISNAQDGYFMDFDNSGWSILSQDIITNSDQEYDIFFDTYATQIDGNQFAWAIDGGALNYITTTTSWTTNHDTFLGTGGSTNVAFYMATDDGTGVWCLDNIDVSAKISPVPEPTTMLLFGTGLVGLVGLRVRRKKKI